MRIKSIISKNTPISQNHLKWTYMLPVSNMRCGLISLRIILEEKKVRLFSQVKRSFYKSSHISGILPRVQFNTAI